MEWTFETLHPHGGNEWHESTLRFPTKEAAAKEAIDWLLVSLANDFLVAVRVKSVKATN